ncbi:MAG: DUF4115 domain-containing protein [Candidatus Eisenbacteria sp.]|nr:DUF4115 domain-containing protein [Candidatus Eisenbacteria bacterium]
METPGQFLREQREERGKSLEEIAAQINLRTDVLRNLEADLFNFAPAPVYVVGALTAYARALGVDPSEVLDRYHGMLDPQPSEPPKEPEPPHRGFPIGRNGIIGAAVLVVLIVLVVLLGRRNPTFREEAAMREAVPEEAIEIPAIAPPVVETAPERVVLQMSVHESTWVGLEMDGEKRYSALLAPGAWRRWEADSTFSITIGNAGGVDLTLDGETVDLPRQRGRVVMLDLPERDGNDRAGGRQRRPAAPDTTGARDL